MDFIHSKPAISIPTVELKNADKVFQNGAPVVFNMVGIDLFQDKLISVNYVPFIERVQLLLGSQGPAVNFYNLTLEVADKMGLTSACRRAVLRWKDYRPENTAQTTTLESRDYEVYDISTLDTRTEEGLATLLELLGLDPKYMTIFHWLEHPVDVHGPDNFENELDNYLQLHFCTNPDWPTLTMKSQWVRREFLTRGVAAKVVMINVHEHLEQLPPSLTCPDGSVHFLDGLLQVVKAMPRPPQDQTFAPDNFSAAWIGDKPSDKD